MSEHRRRSPPTSGGCGVLARQSPFCCRAFFCALVFLILATQAHAIDRKRIDPHINPSRLIPDLTITEGLVLGIPFCMAISPMLSSALKNRELTLQEAYESMAGCIIPLVGGLIVRYYWPQPWTSERFGLKPQPLDLSIRSQS